MPKSKKISKLPVKPTKSISSLKLLALTFLGAFLLIGGYLYSTMQKSGINEVREVSSEIGRGVAKPAPRDCETVSSISLSGSCGVGSYEMASYTCGKNGNQRKLGAVNTNSEKGWAEDNSKRGNVCKSYTNIYNEAQAACAAACPKPTPTPTPKASPTCKPQPTCAKGTRCPIFKLDASYCGYVPPKPTPVACSQMSGFCVTQMDATTKVCSNYNDSCQKAKICLPQYLNVSCE